MDTAGGEGGGSCAAPAPPASTAAPHQSVGVAACSYYTYRVTAFCPWNNCIETMELPDPYSRCTAANGERTLILDMG